MNYLYNVMKETVITHVRVAIIAVFLLFSASVSSWADDRVNDKADDSSGGINYAVSISGIDDKVLKSSLEEKSLLFKHADSKPETVAALNRRIKNDLKSFKTVMQENAYYAATVSEHVADEVGRKQVTIIFEPGPVYLVDDFIVHWPASGPPAVKGLADLELPAGKPALPAIILDAEQALLTALMQNGFPFPQVGGRKLSVNHADKSITVELFIDQGIAARFGAAQLSGLKRVEEAFIRRRIAWQEGEVFNIEKVAATRKALTRSGVIASVDIQYGTLTADGHIPVMLEVKESKHRSVGAGVAYSTTRELVGNVFWEHRNLFGQAEKLRVTAEGGTATYALGGVLNKPDMFGNNDLSWQNSVEFRQEFLEAYDKDTAAAATSLHYKYSPTSAVSAGLALERSRIEEEGQRDQVFTLVALPMTYRYDGSDDFLNPRQGFRANVGVTPYQVLNEQNSFIKSDMGVSHYWPAGESFVWANRARAAVIYGQTLADIPADKRLYAGGGGSVRGYGYQLLGPLDENNNPTGGRMALEVGTEGRIKFTETIEGVGFVEGGRVSEDIEFSSDAEFLWGAGAGMRYHSAIGPLRVDVALPLDKRKPDEAFQFYISLGQAF